MAKILIIEDDRDVLALIQSLLEREGFEVMIAEDGVEGMEAFVQGSPDMVITDLYMPRMKGIEAIKRIRDIKSDAKILAISGGGRYSPKTHLSRAKRAGATEILTKPFEPSELLSAVNRLI